MRANRSLHTRRGAIRTVVVAVLSVWLSANVSASGDNESPAVATFSDILALEAPSPSLEATYGSDVLQTTLFFETTGSLKKHVVLIHGGCWSNRYSRAHIAPLAAALADEGFSVWVPEYRRVGDLGGGWPGTYRDVAAAINYIAHQVDEPLIAVGHSAGGHLALLAASDPDVALAGAVGLAAITDLGAYSQQEGPCPAMARDLMGATYADSPRQYRAASVRAPNITVPAHLIRGNLDSIVGEDQLAGFTSKQISQIPNAGHFDLIHPNHMAFSVLVDVLTSPDQ